MKILYLFVIIFIISCSQTSVFRMEGPDDFLNKYANNTLTIDDDTKNNIENGFIVGLKKWKKNRFYSKKYNYEIDIQKYSTDNMYVKTNLHTYPLISFFTIIPIPTFLFSIPAMIFSNNECKSNNIILVFDVREYNDKKYNLFSNYTIIPEKIYIEDKYKNVIYANSVEKIIYSEGKNYNDVKYFVNIPISCKEFNNSTLTIDGIYFEGKNKTKSKLNFEKYKVRYEREIYFFFFGA